MRLLVHVEGQTEEGFVNGVLRGHLVAQGYHSVSARIVGNARMRARRGGIRPWAAVKKEILNHLKGDSECIATTMVDYYGLPQGGSSAWPGRATAAQVPANRKSAHMEQALIGDFQPDLVRRFVPYVVVHEFETLLFSDCATFGRAIGKPDLTAKLQEIRDQFHSPEEIDDSPVTAPSKRVETIFPGYQKPLNGEQAAREIGLDRIRAECPQFDAWIKRLEAAVLR